MSFPPVYAPWLEGMLEAPIPEESRATCLECPMRTGTEAEVTFHPDTKCCTFFPELPNFSVGHLFLDDDPAIARGRALVEKRLEVGQQITPMGIGRPGAYYAIYGRSETFGIVHTLRCPYYINEGPGLCGIWRYREATCSTWYCKHERGRSGLQLWGSIRRVLKQIEVRLAFLIATEMGIDRDAITAVRATTNTLSRATDPEYYDAIWGPWAGREIEFYKACGHAVKDMSWDAVRERCGDILDPYIADARHIWAQVKDVPELPNLIQIRPFRRVGKVGDMTTLKTYSPFDAMALPDRTVAALVQNERGTVDEIMAATGLDRPTLSRMMDLDLLEPGDE